MSRGRACTQGKGLSASNSAPCMIISEVIKELEIERKKKNMEMRPAQTLFSFGAWMIFLLQQFRLLQ